MKTGSIREWELGLKCKMKEDSLFSFFLKNIYIINKQRKNRIDVYLNITAKIKCRMWGH